MHKSKNGKIMKTVDRQSIRGGAIMKKILIADDEKSLRFLIRETLEMNNYIIFEADNGEKALELVDEKKPDLLLLDIMMPKMTGFEVAEALKDSNNKPNIIMLTAKGQQEDRGRGMECGADYFLTKPFSPIALLELVEEILS